MDRDHYKVRTFPGSRYWQTRTDDEEGRCTACTGSFSRRGSGWCMYCMSLVCGRCYKRPGCVKCREEARDGP